MLRYKSMQIQLKNRLSFWSHFHSDERFFMYNPLKKEFVMGAKRLKTVKEINDEESYLYAFSTMTFSNGIKDEKWKDFGNESVIYEYYLVEKDGIQTLFYLDNPVEINDVEIEKGIHWYRQITSDYDDWYRMFSIGKKAIETELLKKIVLSREVELACDSVVQVERVIQNLCDHNPNCFIYAYNKDNRTFLGASPEILVHKEDGKIMSHALAGTLSKEQKSQNLHNLQDEQPLNDLKNQEEHQIVVDMIADVFAKYNDIVNIGKTEVVSLKNLYHLRTPIDTKDSACVSVWAKRLHPTPAMGGYPVEAARRVIAESEHHERGLYASPLGLIEGNGDGVYVAGIRSALIIENKVFAYAGCGIINDSVCMDEYMETMYKLKTITESL